MPRFIDVCVVVRDGQLATINVVAQTPRHNALARRLVDGD